MKNLLIECIQNKVAAFINAIINLFSFKKKPCAINMQADTVFTIRNIDDSCPDPSNYDLAYFNPYGNPLKNNLISKDGPDGISDLFLGVGVSSPINPTAPPTFSIGNQTLYSTMLPQTSTKFNVNNLNVSLYRNGSSSNSEPLNMCPQSFIQNSSTLKASQFAGAVPMPFGLDPSIWIIPGLAAAEQSANGISAPALIKNVLPSLGEGLASTLYIIANKSCSIYLELGGAYGGDVDIYTAGIDPLTGKSRQTIGYLGGRPGVVYGNYSLKQNDVLKVFLGSVGDPNISINGVIPFDGNGQGGIGTIFGGANGGGPSYAVHYKASNYSFNVLNTFNAAFDNLGGLLVCVAGAGGGASRNASGGAGGFSVNKNYGDIQDLNSWGSAGGSSFIQGEADILLGHRTNGLSGGGGTLIGGGISAVANQQPARSSFGSQLKPFMDFGHGGASVVTNTSSGGGGGGGGYFGGAAGAWNNVSKPNNVHGSGGGGSSYQGLLESTTPNGNVCLNLYKSQYSDWTTRSNSKYGYMVLGLKVNS